MTELPPTCVVGVGLVKLVWQCDPRIAIVNGCSGRGTGGRIRDAMRVSRE